MTRLSKLRSRLRKLRRRRRRVRLGAGCAALAVALLWTAVAAFGVDWLLELSRSQRIVLLGIVAGVLIWVFWCFVRPRLRVHETELDMALMVQRQHHIDSDLVAALQFESPEAARWGSLDLERRVIDRTAQLGERLKVMRGFSWKHLIRTAIVLSATGALIALGAWQFPNHASVFLNRMLFGPQHYPTRTTIESVKINGHQIEPIASRRRVIASPAGQPVRFELTCSGQSPNSVKAELKTDRGEEATVVLKPVAGHVGVFTGQLPRLADSVDCRLSVGHLYTVRLGPLDFGELLVGDAHTDPLRLEVVPLPMIEIELEVTPPSYAGEAGSGPATATGVQQISVIEGSHVVARIGSDKVLEQAVVSIDGEEYPMVRRPASAVPKGRDGWVLQTEGTPLDVVIEPIRYAIQVTDVDGLQLERPIRGAIRIEADRRPQITASIVTQYVLPEARPTVYYHASDDYGLARLAILPEVIREGGSPGEIDPIVVYDLPAGPRWRTMSRIAIASTWPR